MKFNSRVKPGSTKTTNYEGGLAFKLDPITELYTRVATCLVNEPKFYGETGDTEKRILELIDIVSRKDPEFILQLAKYARNKLYLRSIPIVLLGQAALKQSTKPFVREYTSSIIKRADEPAEVISYIKSIIGDIGDQAEKTMLPNALRKGLNNALRNFNKYQFQKYNGANNDVSMQDVVRLVHPKPVNEEHRSLYRDIAKGTLGPADTWETYISKNGSNKETWEHIIPKMPIMAILRNLRNFLDHKCDLTVPLHKLRDEKTILNSKQFPFRFYSAYKAIEDNSNHDAGLLMAALEDAMDISIQNIPKTDGITAVFTDNSGSMTQKVSEKSEVTMRMVGAILGAIATKLTEKSISGVFGESFKNLNYSARSSILERAIKADNTDVGMATNAYLAFDYLLYNKIKVDRILLFSDMQCYDSTSGPYFGTNSRSTYGFNAYSSNIHEQWIKYKKEINPNCYLYSFDLAGYGTSQVPQGDPKVLLVGGWSENILKYIPYFERDSKTVIQEIRNGE
jgi:60 kDa SS-A/Ro ribonucleoprotein